MKDELMKSFCPPRRDFSIHLNVCMTDRTIP